MVRRQREPALLVLPSGTVPRWIRYPTPRGTREACGACGGEAVPIHLQGLPLGRDTARSLFRGGDIYGPTESFHSAPSVTAGPLMDNHCRAAWGRSCRGPELLCP